MPTPTAPREAAPRIPISRPSLGAEEERAAAEALRSGWIGQGPRVAAFEAALAQTLGAPEVVVLSSGTAALHLALLALDVGPGDEVVVPASSFVATANAVLMTGARPVFADVDPHTANLDPEDATRRFTPRTRALMVVHQLGLPANLEACLALCESRGIPLVEDAACALGARVGGTPIGRPHGAVACFSFHPRKVITTGEGGAVTTADAGLATRLRALRNHGAEAGPGPAHHGGAVRYPALGYNARLSDLAAAVGIVQLGRLSGLVARRAALAARYHQRLGAQPDLELPELSPPGVTPCWQSYQLLLGPGCALPRDIVADALSLAGIDTRPGLTAIHTEPLYTAGAAPPSLPGTERVAARGLMLPLYPELTEAEVDRVCEVLLGVLSAAP